MLFQNHFAFLCAGMSNKTYEVLYIPSINNFCSFKEINAYNGGHSDLQLLVGGDMVEGIVLKHESRRQLRSAPFPDFSCLILHFNKEATNSNTFRMNRMATNLRNHFEPKNAGANPLFGDAVLVRTKARFLKDGWNALVTREAHGFEEEDLQFITNNMTMLPTRGDDED